MTDPTYTELTVTDAFQAAIDEHTVIEITDRAFREEVSADFRDAIARAKARYGPHRTTRPVRLEFNGVKNAVKLQIGYVFHPDTPNLKPHVEIIYAAYAGIGWDMTELLGKPLLDALAADILLRECKEKS